MSIIEVLIFGLPLWTVALTVVLIVVGGGRK